MEISHMHQPIHTGFRHTLRQRNTRPLRISLGIAVFLLNTVFGYTQSAAQDREIPADAASTPGVTELMLAAGESRPAVVREILQDATPTVLAAADENGNTALHWAAFYATNPDTVDALLDAEVPVDQRNSQGLTAFEIMQGNDSLLGTDAYHRLLRAKLGNRGR